VREVLRVREKDYERCVSEGEGGVTRAGRAKSEFQREQCDG